MTQRGLLIIYLFYTFLLIDFIIIEFYKQLLKDTNEKQSQTNINQRKSVDLNKSESMNTTDSNFTNGLYDRNDDSGIGGSIHERYDRYFQMKKNLMLSSQLKDNSSDLLHSTLSPVNDSYFDDNHQSRPYEVTRFEENRRNTVASTPTSSFTSLQFSPTKNNVSNPYTTPIT